MTKKTNINDITLLHGLANGQVLQRNAKGHAKAQLRGSTTALGLVRATLSREGEQGQLWKSRPVGKAKAGRFTATLKNIPTGGPYRLILDIGISRMVINRFYVGDVWILAGQSNMEGCGSLTTPTPVNPLVRALYLEGHWGEARDPLHNPDQTDDPDHAPTQWSPAVRVRLHSTRTKGVGPGIAFGSEMAKRSGGVPQGLLCCAHGGTSMGQWDPRQKHPAGWMYGSMLRIWKKTGQPVAGVLWYQGEQETTEENAPLYFKRMTRFVRLLRQDLRQSRLPFLLVQLAREHGEYSKGPSAALWNQIQTDQTRLAHALPRTACVTAIDLPLEDNIHLRSEGQFRLGKRLAAAADRLAYGNHNEPPPIEIASVIRSRHFAAHPVGKLIVEVTFRNVVGGLRFDGNVASGFSLMNTKGEALDLFYHFETRGNKVRLEAMTDLRFPEEHHLVYGHGRNPTCSLVDESDRAVPVFGPIPIRDPLAFSHPLTRWNIGTLAPDVREVEAIALPPPAPEHRIPEWENLGFVKPAEKVPTSIPGVIFFMTEIEAPEAMSLNLRLGYDAPIRLWLDGKVVFTDPHGTNPLIIDEAVIPLRLPRGKHLLQAALDFRSNRAVGFLLRLERTGLLRKRVLLGHHTLPQCCLT